MSESRNVSQSSKTSVVEMAQGDESHYYKRKTYASMYRIMSRYDKYLWSFKVEKK